MIWMLHWWLGWSCKLVCFSLVIWSIHGYLEACMRICWSLYLDVWEWKGWYIGKFREWRIVEPYLYVPCQWRAWQLIPCLFLLPSFHLGDCYFTDQYVLINSFEIQFMALYFLFHSLLFSFNQMDFGQHIYGNSFFILFRIECKSLKQSFEFK